MALQDSDFALVIGINDYPSYGVGGNNLQGPVDDAREFAAWLTDRTDGGGLPDDHCELNCPLPVEDAGGSRSFIAYATEFQQAAFEGQGAAERVRGHLTTALLEALRGAAPLQPGGGVAADDLNAYLENRVPEIAEADQRRQHVEVDSSLSSSPPTIFGSRRPLQSQDGNCRVRFSAGRRGPIRLESPSLQVLREDSVTSALWTQRLDIGHHRLLDLATGEERFFVQRTLDEVNDVCF